MHRMSACCRSRGWVAAILLALLSGFACSRPTPNVPTEGAAQPNPSPFQARETSAAEPGDLQPSGADSPGTSPPFQNSETVPVGSLVTVRLKTPLVAGSQSKDPFQAVLDEPVVVEGNTLISRDATVFGEIESVHVSKTEPDRAFLRLTLSSIQVNGTSLPIQTSSLFARQLSASHANPGTIRLEKGRRLTFRLRQEVFLHSGTSKDSQ